MRWPALLSERRSSIERVTVEIVVDGNTHMFEVVLSYCLQRSAAPHLMGVRRDI